MATLDALKRSLREAEGAEARPSQPLSDEQYSSGFEVFMESSGGIVNREFVVPQLAQLLSSLVNLRDQISVLEIGPGPESVLGSLPVATRRAIKRYTAYEPNELFAAKLEQWLCPLSKADSPLPSLKGDSKIKRVPFSLELDTGIDHGKSEAAEKFDIILFCHSMYGLKPKRRFLEKSLDMLAVDGLTVIFHREAKMPLEDIVIHQKVSFPTGLVRVADEISVLDRFTRFVAGLVLQDTNADCELRAEWRQICRDVGRREEDHPGHIIFRAPDVMMTFTRHAATLSDLMAEVPSARVVQNEVKNREARVHQPALMVKPKNVEEVQRCVLWALKNSSHLTVIGGGHSGHCVWPNVVSVDMRAFDQVHVVRDEREKGAPPCGSGVFIVAEAGCKTGDIVRKTMAHSATAPLGSRPSVGAGSWLQGGIGHLSRIHGLACDAIVGAIIVSVANSQVLCVGYVPSQHQPAEAVRPVNEADILWAIKGAGTNFGIVIAVTFEAFAASSNLVRNWRIPLHSRHEAQLKLRDFDQRIAKPLSREDSADAYLYSEADTLHLGVSTVQPSVSVRESPDFDKVLGSKGSCKMVDGVGMFDTEMYVAGMHGGHAGGKTSSFKRCLFLKCISSAPIADILVAAIDSRPTPLCYLHLLHGGGRIADVPAYATAFGCRDWDFACVITGVWPRDQDGTETARDAVQWVYKVAGNLLPLSAGAYGADLGPGPRDVTLAAKAFGRKGPRLARLKRKMDPNNVLAYACPLLQLSVQPKLIVLVTGEICSGKDFCAGTWSSMLECDHGVATRAVSISEATKMEYAAATGADLNRLLHDRAYKEQHRSALSQYYQDQVKTRPQLPEQHVLDLVQSAVEEEVLFITGMREEAPVATFSHLFPDSRLIEVRVQSSPTQRESRGYHGARGIELNGKDNQARKRQKGRPCLIFDNDAEGNEAAKSFAKSQLLPLLSDDLEQLASMVHTVPGFPHAGVDFRHVLGISQQPGGLGLSTELLRTRFTGDWTKVDALVCCEVGGLVFASALAAQVNVPLALVRDAGKLPPPIRSVPKPLSHVSSGTKTDASRDRRIEMEEDVVRKGALVVVIDDVLASGNTLCAVLQLLRESGIQAQDVHVMIVAEFPIHRGRDLLRRRGFGGTGIQSLLVFGGL